jgi:hypothetical protein
MTDFAQRIRSPAALGAAHRGLDLCLGVAATIPLLAAAFFVCLEPAGSSGWVRTLAVIWTSSLLTFFAGVRRGLTFSEAGGGRAFELATMLLIFMVGVLSLVLVSPAVPLDWRPSACWTPVQARGWRRLAISGFSAPYRWAPASSPWR